MEQCAHARFVWNLAVEQHSYWQPGRKSAPGYLEQCRQLTQARAEHPWLAAGSQMVQQQALRDFARAMAAFYDPANPARRPSWRKARRNEGFRIVAVKPGHVRRLGRKSGDVWVPKAGWVRFRWSRAVPTGVKSYRVEKVNPAFTSQRCSACGHLDAGSRESQARFACTACGFACNADVNAAKNIAAGHAVTARGGFRDAGPMNREPQLLASLTRRE
jgi:transposase